MYVLREWREEDSLKKAGKSEVGQMIFTVTLNPAVDKTVEIPSFAVDAVNRVTRVQKDPGGKGINVSKLIENLGGDSVAYAVLGGETGAEIERMLSGCRFRLESIHAEQATRTNLKVVDPELHTNTDINEPGGFPGGAAMETLREELKKRLGEGDILVLSGSVPPGVDKGIYQELTRMGKERGARVLLDADGPLFSLGIEAVPYMVKPNRYELEQYFGTALTAPDSLVGAGRKLLEKGIRVALISLGGEGALMCRSDKCVRAEGLSVQVASTVGAGDSMVAAFAYGMDRGMDEEDAFRLSVAAASAAVTCSGSQAPEAELVRTLYAQVKLHDV